MRQRIKADATCPHCSTLFEDLSVEQDEDGAYVEIPTEPCHDDECTVRLCSSCPQFACACCGLTFCMEHLGREEDPECTCVQTDVDQFDARYCGLHGTRYPKILYWCRVCAAPEVVETQIVPAADPIAAIVAEVA